MILRLVTMTISGAVIGALTALEGDSPSPRPKSKPGPPPVEACASCGAEPTYEQAAFGRAAGCRHCARAMAIAERDARAMALSTVEELQEIYDVLEIGGEDEAVKAIEQLRRDLNLERTSYGERLLKLEAQAERDIAALQAQIEAERETFARKMAEAANGLFVRQLATPIEVSVDAADHLADRMENPREPTPAMVEMFDVPKEAGRALRDREDALRDIDRCRCTDPGCQVCPVHKGWGG